jgi:hypothetical protein
MFAAILDPGDGASCCAGSTALAPTAALGVPDARIWEVRSEPLHFAESKMLCAVAVDAADVQTQRANGRQ